VCFLTSFKRVFQDIGQFLVGIESVSGLLAHFGSRELIWWIIHCPIAYEQQEQHGLSESPFPMYMFINSVISGEQHFPEGFSSLQLPPVQAAVDFLIMSRELFPFAIAVTIEALLTPLQ